MELNKQPHGFQVVAVKKLEELKATLYQMEHEKSGARLVWLDRVSDNKTFGIAFRTVPEDDTGVFHILEHSVLCGSKRYPVKEPFVELLKSSMQTFLNAMTYPDKTFYPVSSRNDKDFLNLTRVYLDAVFAPAIYEKPEIFHPEGWHYELREGAEPIYKGVVFNEMKGAMASPDELMWTELFRRMFPDTCYRFNSGGDPAHIPELTYEQFIASHRRFYHPSNSYIILDGSVDIDTLLTVLDEEYLSGYDRQEMDTHIPFQQPVDGGKTVSYYEVSPEEPLEKKARAAWGYGLADFTDRLAEAAMTALAKLLCGSNHSPLKQKILAAGIAEDVSLSAMTGSRQSVVALSADNMDENRVDELEELVRETVEEQVRGGLDRAHLKAILSNMELKSRERDYGWAPQGLAFAGTILDSWLYGGAPEARLEVGPLYEELNRLVDTGWYEELLEKVMLKNDHRCRVLLLPSHTVGEEQRQAEAARLAAARESWDEETLARLQGEQAGLDAWQGSEDSPEALATLPGLELSDISRLPEDIPTVTAEVKGVPLLRHELATGGICYWNLYFDVSDRSEEDLSHAAMLCQTLGRLGTARRSALELQKEVSSLMGDLRFALEPYSAPGKAAECRVFLRVSFSALDSKLPQAAALVGEMLRETDFSSPDQIKELLLQTKLQVEQMVIGAGNMVGFRRVMAGVSAEGVVREVTDGFTFLQYLKKQDARELAAELARLAGEVFTSGRLTVSVTGEQNDGAAEAFISGLKAAPRTELTCALKPWGAKREGIIIPADISFAVVGGLCPYSGTMMVASQIASLAYLWNVIRVQGGAYGTGMRLSDLGFGIYSSFRDPKGAQSLESYRKTADFIRDFTAQGPDLTGFIIGAVSGTEPLLLPGRQGALADSWYLKGLTFEQRAALREEMLAATAEKLAGTQEALRAIAGGGVCVVGGKAQVEACELDAVYTL